MLTKRLRLVGRCGLDFGVEVAFGLGLFELAMKYVSTRGLTPAHSFSEAVEAGLAPDGGLFLPEVRSEERRVGKEC